MKKVRLSTLLAAGLLLLSACAGGASAPSASLAVAPPSESASPSAAPASENVQGVLASFTSADLEGNAVDETVLEGQKLTMVNIWATYCGPCIEEMPDLGELAEEYADKGFQIIGVPVDVVGMDGSISEEMISEAEGIIRDTGADYLHLLPAQSMSGLLSGIYAVPTTIFVDEAGTQVGETYLGSKTKNDWTAVIDKLLTEVDA